MIDNVLKNFALFVDGRGYAGQADEVELPKLKVKTEEFRGGGLDAPVEIDMGMEKLEMGYTLSGFQREILGLFGIGIGLPTVLTLRGGLQDENGLVTPMMVNVAGKTKDLDFGTWKPGDKAQCKAMMSVSYLLITHGVIPVIEIDVPNMVRRINGIDQLLPMKLALGV